jgi:hypothetical protein
VERALVDETVDEAGVAALRASRRSATSGIEQNTIKELKNKSRGQGTRSADVQKVESTLAV